MSKLKLKRALLTGAKMYYTEGGFIIGFIGPLCKLYVPCWALDRGPEWCEWDCYQNLRTSSDRWTPK